jgi:hypothetical protein
VLAACPASASSATEATGNDLAPAAPGALAVPGEWAGSFFAELVGDVDREKAPEPEQRLQKLSEKKQVRARQDVELVWHLASSWAQVPRLGAIGPSMAPVEAWGHSSPAGGAPGP